MFVIVSCEFVIWLADTGVPAGDGCGFNFVPVMGRGRGCRFVNPLPVGNVPVAIHTFRQPNRFKLAS